MKVMSLSPKVLLSKEIRDRCVANLKHLPNFVTSTPSESLKYASVLIPICVRDGKVHILYTLRSLNLKTHSGQVSFPGGKMDGNESIVDTALREAEEEIGVSRDAIDVWATMPNFKGANNDLIITPVIGEIKNFDYNKLTPNKDEVEEIFTVPIESLCDTNTHAHILYNEMPMPLFLYDRFKIWGITGFMTHMFLMNLLPGEIYQFNFNSHQYNIEDLRQSKL